MSEFGRQSLHAKVAIASAGSTQGQRALWADLVN